VDHIADYPLVRSLGAANYGELYLATPPARLNLSVDHVVVKVLSGMSSEDAFRRASRELRAFASVQSPHLVTLYDAGQDGPAFFYAMEYSPLGTLDAPLGTLERADIDRAVGSAARAADALHDAGVLHRAISPAAVLIVEDGAGAGAVTGKLTDLGLAEIVNPGQTATSVGGVGSVEFIDPSILLGERASRRSDIWSLGATLHQALAGRGLFGELPPEPLAAIRKVLTGQAEVDPSIPAAERSIIERCVGSDTTERFATARELADELDRVT
jgi:serine/threonine protein kinase